LMMLDYLRSHTIVAVFQSPHVLRERPKVSNLQYLLTNPKENPGLAT